MSNSIEGYWYTLSLVRRGCQSAMWSLKSLVQKLVLVVIQDINNGDRYDMTTSESCASNVWLQTGKHVTANKERRIHKKCADNRYAIGCETSGLPPESDNALLISQHAWNAL